MSLEDELKLYADEVETACQMVLSLKTSTLQPALRTQIIKFQQIATDHKKQCVEFEKLNQPHLNTLSSLQFILAPVSRELKAIEDQISMHEQSIKLQRLQLTHVMKNFELVLRKTGL